MQVLKLSKMHRNIRPLYGRLMLNMNLKADCYFYPGVEFTVEETRRADWRVGGVKSVDGSAFKNR